MRIASPVVLLLALLAPLNSSADLWQFSTPPAARKRFPIDADWRRYETLECDVQYRGDLRNQPILCTVFIQNKQDLWVKARVPLILNGESQTIRLRLDDASPDWTLTNGRRPFGRDLLRWVRAWGIEIFYPGRHSGRLLVGDVRLTKATPGNVELVDITAPETAACGRRTPIRFRIANFHGNPFDSAEVSGRLLWRERGHPRAAQAYFLQKHTMIAVPGEGRPVPRPLGRPCWQVDWSPGISGRLRPVLEMIVNGQRLSHTLDTVLVTEAVADERSPREHTISTEFLRDAGSGRFLEYIDGAWTESDAARGIALYWSVALGWTPRWGHYTGYGEFDQLLAWKLERALLASAGKRSLPIMVFNEDEVDDSGKYNWADHPLNRANGGLLDRPFDLFRDSEARRIIRNRARYVWQRFGSEPAVSGIMLLANRPEQAVTNWIDATAAELAAEFPRIRVFCNNPEFLPRAKSLPLDLFKYWTIDPRLTEADASIAAWSDRRAVIDSSSTGSVGIVADWVQHWVGAQSLSCDIRTSAECGDKLAVACMLRTEPGVVFQSELALLREGDDNRVVFALDRPGSWHCLQDVKRQLAVNDLLNIREVGLRFFSEEPVEVDVSVGNCRAHWPYTVDYAKRPPLEIRKVVQKAEQVPLYGLFALDFEINRMFRNPYDPAEIDVMLELSTPDGAPLSHPAYYHEPWALEYENKRERAVRSGPPFWRARFTPYREGTYKWRLVARAGEDAASTSGTFTCKPRRTKGFVRLSEKDPRQFEFSDGTYYFPIGCNLRSPSDSRGARFSVEAGENSRWAHSQGTRAYEKWFRSLRENGANFARVWMSPWWCGLEWNAKYSGYHGIGYYNQAGAARLDRVLELAEKEGVYLNLETINHGCLSTRIDADWHNSPYNVRQPGGYLRSPSEFFTDKRSLASHRQRLRYTIARWGHSTAIAWWGVITEAEWVEPYDRTLSYSPHRSRPQPPWFTGPAPRQSPKEVFLNWITDCGGYIRRTDAHPHVISVHFSNPSNGLEIWDRPHMDVVHNNAYTFFATMWKAHRFRDTKGVVDVCRAFAEEYEPYRKQKPLVIGEWGGGPMKNTEQHLLAEFHTGSWAILMTTVSGVTGYWWWNLIDGKNLYPEFANIAAFMKGEDRRGKEYRTASSPVSFPEIEYFGRAYSRHAISLYNETELFAYIYNRAINRYNASVAPNHFADDNFPDSGVGTLLLPREMDNGKYRLEYWNTFTAKIIREIEVDISAGQRTIPIIAHRVDLAIKLKPVKTQKRSPAETAESPAVTPSVARQPAPDVASLIRELCDGNWEVGWAAVDKLADLGTPAVPPLLKVLRAREDAAQWRAAAALGRIGPPADEALPLLREVALKGGGILKREATEAILRIQGQP